jgi:hypothetical protein
VQPGGAWRGKLDIRNFRDRFPSYLVMGRIRRAPLLALIGATFLGACNEPSASSTFSPSAIASISAAATTVRVTRDPGLFVMPQLDETITNQQTVRRLASDVLALPAGPSGTQSCPADFGTSYTLRFTGGAPWSAVVEVFGCRTVRLSDGRNLWSLTTPSFEPDLAAALGLSTGDFSPIPCTGGQTRCYPQPRTNMGLVTGGIIPCAGIPNSKGPHYAAGTVLVLRGVDVLQTGAPVISQAEVTRQQLTVNQGYLFALPPGSYVLQAQLQPPGNARPFVGVTVEADKAIKVDIPNICK